MSTGALPGFRDFYPAEFAERSHIFTAWRNVARRFGFLEYDGPPLEPLELYTKKSGDEIVGQLYNFEDKGGRQVALRPEMTPTVARMVAARANSLRRPVRWFTMPQLFRYERQQKGRLREHYQLNVDIFVLTDAPTAPSSRAWDRDLATDYARDCGWPVISLGDFDRALEHATTAAKTVLVTGSFHTVGDAMARLNVDPVDG